MRGELHAIIYLPPAYLQSLLYLCKLVRQWRGNWLDTSSTSLFIHNGNIIRLQSSLKVTCTLITTQRHIKANKMLSHKKSALWYCSIPLLHSQGAVSLEQSQMYITLRTSGADAVLLRRAQYIFVLLAHVQVLGHISTPTLSSPEQIMTATNHTRAKNMSFS